MGVDIAANLAQQQQDSDETDARATPGAEESADLNGVNERRRPQERSWVAYVLALFVALAAVMGMWACLCAPAGIYTGKPDSGTVVSLNGRRGVPLERVGQPPSGERMEDKRRV